MVTLGYWGNSLSLRLESGIVSTAGLRPGQRMTLRLRDDGSILVMPVAKKMGQRAASETYEAPPPVQVKW